MNVSDCHLIKLEIITHLWPDWLLLLPRTQTSRLFVSMKICAQRKAGGENGRGFASLLSPSHGPLRFVNSHSFLSARLYAKIEASQEEVVIFIFLLFFFFLYLFQFLYLPWASRAMTTPHRSMNEWMSSPIVTTVTRSINQRNANSVTNFLSHLRHFVEKVIFTIPTKSLSVNSSSL